MVGRTSEVPLDRQDAIENAEDDGSGFWLDLHPPTDWYDCPEWGTRLSGQSLFHDRFDDILAVADSCTHDDCLARWGWEKQTDECHYRGTSEVVAIGERTLVACALAEWELSRRIPPSRSTRSRCRSQSS